MADGNIYLAMSVRNAGNGIAVLQAWHAATEVSARPPPERDQFRPHTRDLYIPAGDIGFWQAAVRDPNDGLYPGLIDAVQRTDTSMSKIVVTNNLTLDGVMRTHQHAATPASPRMVASTPGQAIRARPSPPPTILSICHQRAQIARDAR